MLRSGEWVAPSEAKGARFPSILLTCRALLTRRDDPPVQLARDALRRTVTPGPHALSVGVFDGVHHGHQALVARMTTEARGRGLSGGVVTFHPSPVTVLRPGTPFAYLMSLEQRIELLGALPRVEFTTVLQFTSDLAQVSAAGFAQLLAEEAHMRLLVVGEDFAFGRGREGNVPRLRQLGEEYGFEVIGVSLTAVGGERVSSTRVRQALAEGAMEDVTRLLGRPLTLRGPVLHGDERGRAIGFPTINLGVSPDRALPPDGVYVAAVQVAGRTYRGATNIGIRPTFDGVRRQVETHILDFEGDLYEQTVELGLLHRLRGEEKFADVDALVAQIQRDVQAVREYSA